MAERNPSRLRPNRREEPRHAHPIDPPSSDDINVLLLGPTGIGKTTMINAIPNYLSFDTVEAAVRGDITVLIPTVFTFYDSRNLSDMQIRLGEPDEYEQFDREGESATQVCRSFVFPIGNRKLRMIDAPGIGDTRGVDQDKKNFTEILNFISQYDHLNALCILLRPNEERLTVQFKFCVNELLRHLHTDSRQNLAFIFTNGRTTFYRPGKSRELLANLFRNHQADGRPEIPLNTKNTFTFDNEAFRYLAIRKRNITLPVDQAQSYENSWIHSVKEMSRFLEFIRQLPRHPIQNIGSLHAAEQWIRRLPRPIAEATRLIAINVQQAQRYKQKVLQDATQAVGGIPQNLGLIHRLANPRTVCASVNCRKIVEDQYGMRIEYTSICHKECYLTQIEQETLAHPKLEDCTAMNYETGNCLHCGCHWQSHKHITYENVRSHTNSPNLSGNGPVVTDQSVFLTDVDKWIKSLKEESRNIQDIYKQCATFLQAKAIIPVNHAYADYVKYFIEEEESKNQAGAQNQETIDNLKEIVKEFKEHITRFTEIIRQNPNNDNTDLTPEKISDLARELYKQPITGVFIKEQVEAIGQGERRLANRRENMVQFPAQAASSNIMKETIKIFQ